jgi:hypothetical protein
VKRRLKRGRKTKFLMISTEMQHENLHYWSASYIGGSILTCQENPLPGCRR